MVQIQEELNSGKLDVQVRMLNASKTTRRRPNSRRPNLRNLMNVQKNTKQASYYLKIFV